MPMLEHYNRRDSGFGEQLMGSCDGEYDVDVCTGVAHTMTFGDILRFSIGDAEYEDTIIWAVDDCGLWFRDANYIPDPPDGWAPQEARRGRYYVAPRQPDGSYLLDRWGNIGKGFRFTQLSGNFLKVRFERCPPKNARPIPIPVRLTHRLIKKNPKLLGPDRSSHQPNFDQDSCRSCW